MNNFLSTKKILFVTGTRADFGKIEPLATAARNAGCRVEFFITGMHMLEQYGLTKIEVTRLEGVDAFEFLNQRPGDPQDAVLAKTIGGFSDFVVGRRPDLAVIHGDRVESIACALVCATNYVRCAHIEGGEISGTIDEVFRHCNTKLATCHFVSSESARRRVLKLGESADSVFTIGSPEIDAHAKPSGVSIEEVRRHYEIPFSDYGIAAFHSVTSEIDTIGEQARSLFGALEKSARNFVVILPNNDPGSGKIFDALDALPGERFRLIPSMRFNYFSELLKNSKAMVGNSSVGVREAPFLGLPSLDIGTRQTRRSSSSTISYCSAFDSAAIEEFLERNWGRRMPSHTAFGMGRASERFIDVLKTPEFWELPLQKSFRDNA
ncbi:MAG: UDP-N-acetylglucosamine 2-epimerase [Albidovulum sp.]|nr:UDP-N-acetylglucosamine 2-epimerase [Albidovulum sp.]